MRTHVCAACGRNAPFTRCRCLHFNLASGWFPSPKLWCVSNNFGFTLVSFETSSHDSGSRERPLCPVVLQRHESSVLRVVFSAPLVVLSSGHENVACTSTRQPTVGMFPRVRFRTSPLFAGRVAGGLQEIVRGLLFHAFHRALRSTCSRVSHFGAGGPPPVRFCRFPLGMEGSCPKLLRQVCAHSQAVEFWMSGGAANPLIHSFSSRRNVDTGPSSSIWQLAEAGGVRGFLTSSCLLLQPS